MDCTMERLIHSWNDATQISRSAGHCETFASAAAPNDESILVYLCLFPHSKCKCWETILQIKGFLTLCCIEGATASLAISENCTIVALEGLVEGLKAVQQLSLPVMQLLNV